MNANFSQSLPRHIAIIMDGNGRWANARHKPRVFGHQEGVKTVRKLVEYAADIGIECMTLYSFSTENWNRPKSEIKALFDLLKQYMQRDIRRLQERGVRVRILGTKRNLSKDMLSLLQHVEEVTKDNTQFYLNIAFNYGGRDEIVRAARRLAQDCKAGNIDIDKIDEALFSNYLDTAGQPDPDLVIRTSGEHRISNFLPWQAAYAEFVFTDVLWPSFTKDDLLAAITTYQNRERRFGNLKPVIVA